MLRERGIILQHGSILLTGDQTPTIALLKVQRNKDLVEPAAALTDLLASLPTWHELVDALASGIERVLSIHLERSTLSDEEAARVIKNARQFADPSWTWRY